MHRAFSFSAAAIERFWRYVDTSGDCWNWKGGVHDQSGYGRFAADGKPMLAHRFSYGLHHGEYDPAWCVLHQCDNPKCVRPTHLFLGTRGDNNKDRDKKGRYRKGRVDYGEQHASAKFSSADVEAMRVLAESGKFQQRYIANLFRASEAQVHRIVHGKLRLQG